MKKNENDLESQPTVTTKVPRILCEIFVHGVESEKLICKGILDELQKQMDKARRNKNKIRVCWYIDNGEKDDQEKLEWFKENGKCKYFVILNAKSKVSKDYIKELLQRIRTFVNSFNSLKGFNVNIFGAPTRKQEEEIEEAQIV